MSAIEADEEKLTMAFDRAEADAEARGYARAVADVAAFARECAGKVAGRDYRATRRRCD
jgi:hypothetical protein